MSYFENKLKSDIIEKSFIYILFTFLIIFQQKSKKAKTLGNKKTAKTEIASTEKANEDFSDSSSSKDNDAGDKSKPTTPGGGQKKGLKNKCLV